MSSKTQKRKNQQSTNMENGNHETNGTQESEELKGFTQDELITTKAVMKEITVVLTPVDAIESQIEAEESEKRLTRSQKKENGEKEEIIEDEEKRVTRSQTKENNSEIVDVGSNEDEVVIEAETIESKSKENGESEVKDISDIEKDLEPDETEPELQFDENSDRDSGKNSPASRCLTRRSHLRNLPTPKTPKSPPETTPTPTSEDEDSKINSNISTGDLSTQAQPGNDTTRADFTVNDDEPSEFLKSLRDKSLSDTLRGLSSRRSLRHGYITKSEFNVPYPKRASVESISGMKRKRSLSPEDGKRVKRSSGLLTYITSPVFGVRHRFSKDLASSTPKLTGFRNKNSLLDGEEIDKIKLEVEDEQQEKKWCSIM